MTEASKYEEQIIGLYKRTYGEAALDETFKFDGLVSVEKGGKEYIVGTKRREQSLTAIPENT